MKKLVALALIFGVTLSISQESAVDPATWESQVTAIYDLGKTAEDLSAVKIPHLISSKLEKKWGKPRIAVAADGSYLLTYEDPEHSLERLTIMGFQKPMPTLNAVPKEIVDTIVDGELGSVERAQEWKTDSLKIKTPTGKTTIPIRYFREFSGGGADGPRDMTDTFTLTVDGVTGYYVLSIDSVENSTPKRFKMVDVK